MLDLHLPGRAGLVAMHQDEAAGGGFAAIADLDAATTPAGEPAVVDDAAAAAPPSDAAPAAPPAWDPEADYARQFPGGPADLWKSQREAQAQMTRTQQELAELRRQLEDRQAPTEEAVDPYDLLPPMVDRDTYERLSQHAAQGPQQAAEAAQWAAQYADPRTASDSYAYWESVDPMAARRWLVREEARELMKTEVGSLREELGQFRQEFEPITDDRRQAINSAAIDLAQAEVGDLADYAGRMDALVKENPQWAAAFFDGTHDDPRARAQRIVQLRDLLWAQDQRDGAQQPAAAAPTADAPGAQRGARERAGSLATQAPDQASQAEAEFRRQFRQARAPIPR